MCTSASEILVLRDDYSKLDEFTSKIKIAFNEDITFDQFSPADDINYANESILLSVRECFKYLRTPKDFLLLNSLQLLRIQ